MAKKKRVTNRKRVRRHYTQEFKEEAVQMMLDGHAAASVADRLGLSGTNLLYRWKQQLLTESGPVAGSLEQRVRELEAELRRTQQERDILPLDLSIPRVHILFLLCL